MSTMSIRDELRTYSKSDLTRIAVLATQKQAAAEQAVRLVHTDRRLFAFVTGLIGVAIGAGAVLFFG